MRNQTSADASHGFMFRCSLKADRKDVEIYMNVQFLATIIRHAASDSDRIIPRRVADVTIQVAEQPDDDKNHGLGGLNGRHPAGIFGRIVVDRCIHKIDQAHLHRFL